MKFHQRESLKYRLEADYFECCYKAAKRKVTRLRRHGGAEEQSESYWRLRQEAGKLQMMAIHCRSWAEKLA